jgi:hypothetical protein
MLAQERHQPLQVRSHSKLRATSCQTTEHTTQGFQAQHRPLGRIWIAGRHVQRSRIRAVPATHPHAHALPEQPDHIAIRHHTLSAAAFTLTNEIVRAYRLRERKCLLCGGALCLQSDGVRVKLAQLTGCHFLCFSRRFLRSWVTCQTMQHKHEQQTAYHADGQVQQVARISHVVRAAVAQRNLTRIRTHLIN